MLAIAAALVLNAMRGSIMFFTTPGKIAEEMVKMSEVGFAGTTVSFVNFRDELPLFIEAVLPLLREAGLEVDAAMRKGKKAERPIAAERISRFSVTIRRFSL